MGCQKQQIEGITYIENPSSVLIDSVEWSPANSSELLVTASEFGFLGESEIYIFNPDDLSTHVIAYTSRGDIFGVGWAPTGDKILLAASRDTAGYEDGGLWLWERETEKLSELFCCKGIDAAAMIDENQIIFSPVIGENKGFADLILYNSETGEESPILLSIGRGHIYDFSFSPVRNEMVFAKWDDGRSTIFRYDIDNNQIPRILEDRERINFPIWSPDGSMIAFYEPDPDVEYGKIIIVMDPDTGCEKQIPTSFPAVLGLTWSPDGRKIAFVETEDIVTVDLIMVFGDEFLTPDFLCE
jgi:Tol biopolymer transport system component